MRWLDTFKRNRIAKRYARELPPELRARYGASKTYTAAQIGSTIADIELDPAHAAIGYAAFLTPEDFAIAMPASRLSYSDARALLDRYAITFVPTSAEHGTDNHVPLG
jgi:hypothetical protein